VSCKKAIGVAREMKEKYGERLDVKIYTLDSKEAEPYRLRLIEIKWIIFYPLSCKFCTTSQSSRPCLTARPCRVLCLPATGAADLIVRFILIQNIKMDVEKNIESCRDVFW
jgi:glutamate formiminotransferase